MFISPESYFLYGDGSTVSNAQWHKANISNVVKIGLGYQGVIAYTSAGEYYTWGQGIFVGDGSTFQDSNVPVKMTAPFPTEPSIIMTSLDANPGTYVGRTYYVLSKLADGGEIFVMGNNAYGQLGIGSSQVSSPFTTWNKIDNAVAFGGKK